MIKMDLAQVNKEILQRKKKYGRLISNVIPTIFLEELEAQVYLTERGILFVVPETYRKRAFFSAADEESLIELLQMLPTGTMLEYLYRKENSLSDVLASAGMDEYAVYVRRNISYTENPYLQEGGNRYRTMLQQLYDPSHCEYPRKEDIPELIEASENAFDPLCDEIFSARQWEEAINKNEVLVCRENNHILSYYVFRLEGKKLYSNLTWNDGSANLLYNMERRVFEEMWEKGIRHFYYWQNAKNEKMYKRRRIVASDEIETVKDDLWNAIYIKK